MVLLTVFTPTYNRACTLKRTYASLCHQTSMNFLWLIIDDGSTDETAACVKKWMAHSPFEVQYVCKENGGMHTAHNAAYERIQTELNMCLDSDDCLVPDAVRIIQYTWEKVRKKGYGGMIGLDADLRTGRIIGKKFPSGMKKTTLTGYYAGGGRGDKKLIYRTDVMQTLPPYPVFEGEKYVALAFKYILADQTYALCVINRVLCRVEYRSDGSTRNMWRQYLENPKGFACYRRLSMRYGRKPCRILKDTIHYCSASMLAGSDNFISESPRKMLTVLCIPMGWLLTCIIRRKGHAP